MVRFLEAGGSCRATAGFAGGPWLDAGPSGGGTGRWKSMENLRTIAEVATAFAGFTGVVIVLGRRSEGGWTPAESSTIRILLESSIGVVFLALLPPVLVINVSSSATWRACAGVLAVYHLFVIFRADVLDRRQAAELLGRKRDLGLSILGLGSIAACAAVALGFVAHAAELIYTFSLLYMLFVGALSFAALLVSGGRSDARRGAAGDGPPRS